MRILAVTVVILWMATAVDSAFAQQSTWRLVVPSKGQTVYVNRSAIVDLEPGIVQFWTLTDSDQPYLQDGNIVASTVTLQVANCKARSIGPLQLIAYSGRCGSGEPVIIQNIAEYPNAQMIAPPPNTNGFILLNLMCFGPARMALIDSQPPSLCSQ